MDKKSLISEIQDPEVLKQINKIAEINRKEKRGELSSKEAAVQVVDIAEEYPQLRNVLGMIMQNFSHGKVSKHIEEEMIDRFGEDWDSEQE